jgi:hypothetical protein
LGSIDDDSGVVAKRRINYSAGKNAFYFILVLSFLQVVIGGSNLDCSIKLETDEIKVSY